MRSSARALAAMRLYYDPCFTHALPARHSFPMERYLAVQHELSARVRAAEGGRRCRHWLGGRER